MRVLVLVALSFSFSANAFPRVDSVVSQFLNSQPKFSQTIPVIVQYKNTVPRSNLVRGDYELKLKAQTSRNQQKLFKEGILKETSQVSDLWILNASLVSLTQEQLRSLLKRNDIAAILTSTRLSRIIKPLDDFSMEFSQQSFTYGLKKIKVPELRAKYLGHDGRGIKVGIVDTGLDANHPDLIGRMISFKDFSGGHHQDAVDDHGHGTHVAGTIAGGASSGLSIGVAPGAQLLIAKGFDSQGNSDDKNLLLALQWMADPDGNPNTDDYPQVVSNSWNTDVSIAAEDPQNEPFCQVIDNLNKLNIAMVFAAGNDGSSSNTIKAPGACPNAITVGATDSSDRAASFSSRGPTKWKSVTLNKPDVSAPGVDIESSVPGGDYETKSGTSMATPHIAGVLALILQTDPKLTPAEAKAVLMGSAFDLGVSGADNVFGAGRADALKSVDNLKKP